METDVLVVGAGAAGLAAALAAHARGMRVEILEKAASFGGTSALSGAAIWIPLHHGHDTDDTAENVLRYLDAIAPCPAEHGRREAFVHHAAEALQFFQTNTELAYKPRKVAPDYHQELAGATDTGRVLDVEPYDGKRLGRYLSRLRPALETHLVFGGMMVNRADVQALLQVGRDGASTLHSLQLILRYLRDRLSGYGRGTRLVVGSALIGRLAESVIAAGIPLHFNSPAHKLLQDQNRRVNGVEFVRDGLLQKITATKGVILASGGYPGSSDRSKLECLTPEASHFSMASPSSTGDGAMMAEALGANLGPKGRSAFFRCPVSVHTRPGRQPRQFAHLTLDRAKPGVIAVDASGRRFTNEADSYHRFGEALSRLRPLRPGGPVAWLIADHRTLKRYGLGLARPFPAHFGNGRLIRDGYLIEAPTPEALATRIGLSPEELVTTIDAHNRAAASGKDLLFAKGESSHNRTLGDPDVSPNPCLGTIIDGPFYAVGLYSGDLGTARGLMTNQNAQVTDMSGDPIAGLYAVGNDMHSIMGGTYPGPGITLGPALVFAWIAANHLAQTES